MGLLPLSRNRKSTTLKKNRSDNRSNISSNSKQRKLTATATAAAPAATVKANRGAFPAAAPVPRRALATSSVEATGPDPGSNESQSLQQQQQTCQRHAIARCSLLCRCCCFYLPDEQLATPRTGRRRRRRPTETMTPRKDVRSFVRKALLPRTRHWPCFLWCYYRLCFRPAEKRVEEEKEDGLGEGRGLGRKKDKKAREETAMVVVLPRLRPLFERLSPVQPLSSFRFRLSLPRQRATTVAWMVCVND